MVRLIVSTSLSLALYLRGPIIEWSEKLFYA